MESKIRLEDLMIGGILKYYIGEDGCEWDYCTIDAQDLLWLEKRPLNFNRVHKGVELDAEVLERCGFVNNELQTEHLTFIYYGENNIGIKGMLGMVKPLECQYLHQLQQIFFSLTRRPLVVKI